MFTGLVETLGTVAAAHPDSDETGRWLEINAPFVPELSVGESVSVNGTCLTVVKILADHFAAQLSPTTLALTTLKELVVGAPVNLERSVTPATRLGGHWVLGHVDTVGVVERIQHDGDSHHVSITYPAQYQRWLLPQGSLTIDGISLTLVGRSASQCQVTIIPHTWNHTIANRWNIGTKVNLEFDVLGKYVEQLLAPYQDHTGGLLR